MWKRVEVKYWGEVDFSPGDEYIEIWGIYCAIVPSEPLINITLYLNECAKTPLKLSRERLKQIDGSKADQNWR
jgi:hypothetical protein